MSAESEVVDVEPREVGADLELVASAPVNLFRTEEPNEIIAKATATADALAEVVREKKLSTNIKGREHVRVEGWTLLGSMLGVFAICTETRKLEDGWHARVEARTLSGALVGAAEAECLRSENTWKSRDDYALLSMAQTRATSKALRQPLGFVMTLAGFQATPAEEMPSDSGAPVEPSQPMSEQEDWDRLATLLQQLEQVSSTRGTAGETWEQYAQRFSKEQFDKDDASKLNKAQIETLNTHLEERVAAESGVVLT